MLASANARRCWECTQSSAIGLRQMRCKRIKMPEYSRRSDLQQSARVCDDRWRGGMVLKGVHKRTGPGFFLFANPKREKLQPSTALATIHNGTEPARPALAA